MPTLTPAATSAVRLYASRYPHLRTLADAGLAGDPRAIAALGTNLAQLAYPPGLSGAAALAVAALATPGGTLPTVEASR